MTVEEWQREAFYTQRISELTKILLGANEQIAKLNERIKELEGVKNEH